MNLNAELPDPSELFTDIFAPAYTPKSPAFPLEGKLTSYTAAINDALSEEMRRDEKIILLGEDVELMGGLFGATQNLATQFEGRVKDTPISENTFTGVGIGAAVRGYRPVVELMYMDFFPLAADQIVNLAAKLRYMTGGQVSVPMVIRTASGAGGGGSATHSQSLEAWFYHIPGLKVVMPSCPFDAKGLLKTAIRDDNPVLFLEHKLLYQTKGPVPEEDYAIAFGEAQIRRPGKDLTLVATSAMVNIALQAAEQLAQKDGIEVEVIDPRTIVPLDMATILDSVKKTRNAIVANEAPCRGSFAADLAAQINEQAFELLDNPAVAIGMAHTPIPFSLSLEESLLPGITSITTKVREFLGL